MGSASSKKQDDLPNDLQLKIRDCVTLKGGVDYEKLEELRQSWKLSQCNVGIIGQSGVGKSTIINNLLGVKEKGRDEQDLIKLELDKCDHSTPLQCGHLYAPSGRKETTTCPVPFTFSLDSKVLLWDLPGYGARLYPDVGEYWKTLKISRYDAVLVVLRDLRVRPDDLEVLRFLIRNVMMDRVIWVLTHFDEVIPEDQKAVQEDFRNLIEELTSKKIPIKTFCVGHSATGSFPVGIKPFDDLDLLKTAIIETVPEALQAEIASNFTGYSKELIKAKFVILQKISAAGALVAGGTAVGSNFIPVAGAVLSGAADMVTLKLFYNQVVRIYGFSDVDELLKKLEITPKSELDRFIRAQVGVQVAKALGEIMVQVALQNAASTLVEAGLSFAPIIGPVLAGALSTSVMAGACHYINSKFRDIAFRVIDVIAEAHAQGIENV